MNVGNNLLRTWDKNNRHYRYKKVRGYLGRENVPDKVGTILSIMTGDCPPIAFIRISIGFSKKILWHFLTTVFFNISRPL